jgi:AcrR family transcriptional regulator
MVLATLKNMSPPGGLDARPLLRRDAEHNRQRILDVARAMIIDRGLNISHDQIASQAGLGVGTVYRRFPTLGELFDELFHEQVELIVKTAEAALEIEDPWEGICEFMQRYFEQQAADRGLREYLLGHRGGTELARRARKRVLPVVTELVARAHAAGRLHPDIDAGDFAVIPLLINPVVSVSKGATPDLWRRWLAVVLEGIATGPRRERFPGQAPEPTQLDQIIGKEKPPRAGRS